MVKATSIEDILKLTRCKNYFLSREIYFYLEKFTSKSLLLHNLIFAHIYSGQVIAGPNLELLCRLQLDAAHFCENFAKFYFDAKHFRKGILIDGENCGASIFKNVLFLANIRCCPNFLH